MQPRFHSDIATDTAHSGPPEMSAHEFERVASRVLSMAGIVLEPHKRQMIISRLSRRLRERNFATVSEYLDFLDKGTDTTELQEFVNTLTTNLTSFFREAHHFGHFERNVLSAFSASGQSKLRVWSAGCSSGEEPYSIALSALEALGSLPADLRILATDLDTKMLNRGKAASYAPDRIRDVEARYRRHMLEDPGTDTVNMPRAAVKAITFRQLNLLEPWPMSGLFDVIFCRNVMIYFSAKTKSKLVDQFAQFLAPGGYLYLGHSESLLGAHPCLKSCGETIYQRVA
ncbi:MAG: protein-glutamate O-methyltransferase CheR [Pseudomonadota bacterium]